MKKFFFGGVHPRYNKEMSLSTADLSDIAPKQVIIPLRQHIGAPCKPLVEVGDYVLRGQKIGDGEGMCVPVHSSVSGTVTAIEPCPCPNGITVDSIVIHNDYKDTSVDFAVCDTPTQELDIDSLLHKIREAGIVGMGGAAFPGNIKALSALGKIDTVIANACECEPYITSDDTLLRVAPREVLEGIMLIDRALSPERLVLAIEDNKQEAIKVLTELKEAYPKIELVVLPTRYPQGSEKQLIQAVTRRQVPPAGLPTSVGCVVYNVSTYAAIYRAVRLGMPLIERIVTVTGEAIKRPQNFKVRIGTPFHYVIERAGGLDENTDKVINGGPMMGTAQSDLCVPVIKATNSVLCLPKIKTAPETACIRCGKCLSVCPMKLEPLYLYRFTLAKAPDKLSGLNITDCMECGSCAYTCPAKLPLVEKIREGKILLKEASEK